MSTSKGWWRTLESMSDDGRPFFLSFFPSYSLSHSFVGFVVFLWELSGLGFLHATLQSPANQELPPCHASGELGFALGSIARMPSRLPMIRGTGFHSAPDHKLSYFPSNEHGYLLLGYNLQVKWIHTNPPVHYTNYGIQCNDRGEPAVCYKWMNRLRLRNNQPVEVHQDCRKLTDDHYRGIYSIYIYIYIYTPVS